MSIHRLTETSVKSLIENKPGKHCDGGGLYLQVAEPGQASWVWRHKERWKSLGPANLYSLTDARDRAHGLRKAVHEGKNPLELLARSLARPVGATFGEWLTKYLKIKDTHWTASNRDRERRDHERTFGKIPEFTALPVSAIDPEAKNTALAKLPPSGRRKATSWISAVVNYAQTGVIIQRGAADEPEHHEAMPWAQVPGFYRGIAGLDSDDARALRFTILTGARTDEVIGTKKGGKWTKQPATWREITDVDGQPTWIIPKTRIKGGKQHRVPLTPKMVVLLGERRADDAFLFTVSSQNALLNTLKTNGGNGYTVHGMRSSFEDWGAEATDFPRDLVKLCTAHDKRTKTDKAYQRSDLLENRREIMTQWSDFCAN